MSYDRFSLIAPKLVVAVLLVVVVAGGTSSSQGINQYCLVLSKQVDKTLSRDTYSVVPPSPGWVAQFYSVSSFSSSLGVKSCWQKYLGRFQQNQLTIGITTAYLDLIAPTYLVSNTAQQALSFGAGTTRHSFNKVA